MREKVLHERASFLRDAIFSASDGVITTFAVVTGSTGASLDTNVVLILGFANLFADGISMASGTYLGVKSEQEFERAEGDRHIQEPSALSQGFITFFSFDFAGLIPLIPYVLGLSNPFYWSILFVFLILFVVGGVKAKFTKKKIIQGGIEALLIGGFAAFVAFLTGFLIDKYVL